MTVVYFKYTLLHAGTGDSMARKVKCMKCRNKVVLTERFCPNCNTVVSDSVDEALKVYGKKVRRKNAMEYGFCVALIVFSLVSIVPKNLEVGLLLVGSASLRLPVINQFILDKFKFISATNYLLMTTVLIISGLLMSSIRVVEKTETEDGRQVSHPLTSDADQGK